jgi:hypothetical protein
MRKTHILVILAATLIPVAANAQTASTSEVAPSSGWVDFGVRGSSLTGDAARYERYRDLGDGLFLEAFRWRTETKGWFMDFDASHVARRDQRYIARFARPGRFRGWAMWDQIPMLLSETTRTPYILTGANEFRLPDATQLQLQGLSSGARPAALLALVNASPTFDLKSRRHIGEGGDRVLPGLW